MLQLVLFVFLTVTQAQEVSIIQAPQDVLIDLHSPFTLPCRANLPPSEIRVRWTKDNERIYERNGVRIGADGTLSVQSATREDAGRYVCTVFSRSLGENSSAKEASCYVHVRSAPVFTVPPSDQSVREGTRIRLQCGVLAYPEPIFSWQRNGSYLREERRITIQNTRYSSLLNIYPLMKEDAGSYTCAAVNPIGRVERTATIRIRDSQTPRMIDGPRDAKVRVGDQVSFSCRASGDPTPRIIWQFNGSPIATLRGHYHVAQDNTLRIREVTKEDAGHYACLATNDVGTATADSRLQVFDDFIPTPQRTPTRPPPPVSTPSQNIDPAVIRAGVAQATRNVDNAINHTRTELTKSGTKTPHELLALFRFPKHRAVELARAREIYEESLRIIEAEVSKGIVVNMSQQHSSDDETGSFFSVSHLQMIMELSGCTPQQVLVDACSNMCFHNKYRAYDGQCNNFQKPMQGASLTPLRRFLRPIYENGFNTPVGWDRRKLYHGYPKPNAREVSFRMVATEETKPDPELSAMFMQWGQFLDHDIDLSVPATSRFIFQSGAVCNQTCDNVPPCFNIGLPINDPRRNRAAQRCMEFERSSAVCGSGETSPIFERIAAREQINAITSYIDGSQIYGNSEQEVLDLRDLFSDHGLLRFDIVSHTQKPYLPFNRDSPIDCRRNPNQEHPFRCFLGGDPRANEQLGLLSMHTLWLREHNRIAAEFLTINPHWDGERIYQEARKIVGAELQHITFTHWLPKVLGRKRLGPHRGYNSSVNPAVSNAFATAAFRFGHSLVNPLLYRLNSTWGVVPQGHLPLHEAFFAPERLLTEGGIDPILRGLFAFPAKLNSPTQLLTTELTEKLFGKAHEIALDLGALNIQRGRDHALPSYMDYRNACGLSVTEQWDNLEDIIDPIVRDKLKSLYGHPGNVDLWVGGIVERAVPDGKVGPTFACIIAEQFESTRAGDRFWYENQDYFTPSQLDELRKVSLARVLCDNGDEITRVSEDVFRYAGPSMEDYTECASIPKPNLNHWQECCSSSCVRESPERKKRSSHLTVQHMEEEIEALKEQLAQMQKALLRENL